MWKFTNKYVPNNTHGKIGKFSRNNLKYVVKSPSEQMCTKFGSKEKFRWSKNFFFWDSFSATAKLLAHLQVSQLYFSRNSVDQMKFIS